MEPVKFSANFWENMTTQPLKPCPFCGGVATLSFVGGGVFVDDNIKHRYLNCVPKCTNCYCALTCYPTEEEAIMKWNTRKYEEQKNEIEKLIQEQENHTCCCCNECES